MTTATSRATCQPLPYLKGPTFAARLAEVCRGPLPHTPLPDLKYRRILIPGLLGGEIQVALLGLLGQALRMRGAEVTALLCDRFLPACTSCKAEHVELACERWCYRNSEPFIQALHLPYRWYSTLLTSHERARCDALADRVPASDLTTFEYRGIDLGRHIVRSVESYFKVGACDLQRPEMAASARQFLRAGLYLTHVSERALDELRIDKVFLDDGQKIDWGVIRAVALRRGIPVDVLWHGHRAYSIRFERERPGRAALCMPEWEAWRHQPLTAAQDAELDAYLARHDQNPYDFMPEWRAQRVTPTAVRQMLGLPAQPRGLVCSLFANVGYDAGQTKSGAAFPGMNDWLVATIAHFARWPEHHLLIKAHPAERYQRSGDAALKIIRSRFDPLPPNVHLIPPDTPATAQSILRISDCALLFTSTVAIEAGVLGVPVILAGGGWNARRGFTCDVASPAEHAERLERMCARGKRPPTDVALARRFAYATWFRSALVIDYFDVLGINVRALKLGSWNELGTGRNPVADVICRGILNDDPFEAPLHSPPPAAPAPRETRS